MNIFGLILVAVGLAMDAFAVAICKGLSVEKAEGKHYLIVGLWFGLFQALMPLLGYLLGTTFQSYITAIDHWVAFVLLSLLGIKMIVESCSKKEEPVNNSFSFKTMIVLAIATSIDALAVGITFALLPDVNIWIAISLIGVITFGLSMLGLKIGNVFGAKYKSKAELIGGIILIIIGLEILLEHLGVLSFL